jgi:hypothetical protein
MESIVAYATFDDPVLAFFTYSDKIKHKTMLLQRLKGNSATSRRRHCLVLHHHPRAWDSHIGETEEASFSAVVSNFRANFSDFHTSERKMSLIAQLHDKSVESIFLAMDDELCIQCRMCGRLA